jgi:hypothetical protein
MSARKGNILSIVSQPPPPARVYADFDKWLTLGLDLDALYRRSSEVLTGLEDGNEPYWETVAEPSKGRRGLQVETCPSAQAKGILHKWPKEKLAAKVAKFVDGWEFYEREEQYEAKGDNTKWRLSRRVVCEQVSALLGSFPNAPQVPEVYTRRIIEELVAANPSAVQLEAACRRLVRNCTVVPSVAEALKAIGEVKVPCMDAFDADGDDDELTIIWVHKELEKALAALPAGAPAREGRSRQTTLEDPNDQWDPAL